MYHPVVAMETGFTSLMVILAKHKDLGTWNYVWTQISSQDWKNQNIKKNIYHYQLKMKKCYRATLIWVNTLLLQSTPPVETEGLQVLLA